MAYQGEEGGKWGGKEIGEGGGEVFVKEGGWEELCGLHSQNESNFT